MLVTKMLEPFTDAECNALNAILIALDQCQMSGSGQCWIEI